MIIFTSMYLKVLTFQQTNKVLKLAVFFQHRPLVITFAFNFFPSPLIFQSVSAFSPIVNPINCAWGQKAFTNYLGGNKTDWEVISRQFIKITNLHGALVITNEFTKCRNMMRLP